MHGRQHTTGWRCVKLIRQALCVAGNVATWLDRSMDPLLENWSETAPPLHPCLTQYNTCPTVTGASYNEQHAYLEALQHGYSKWRVPR